MATITSNLKLNTTFQRFLIDFMRDPSVLIFLAAADGTSATLSSSLSPDRSISLFGIGLQTDAVGNPIGQLTAISITNSAGTKGATITSLPGTRLEDLLFAAQDGTGPANQSNFADFYFSLTLTQNLTVSGTKFGDVIEGGTGGSDDMINGKRGNDTIILRFGNDQIDGGRGTDTVQVDDILFDPGLKVNLKAGTVEVNTVVSTLANIENVEGTEFRDVIGGSDKANVLNGFEGKDILFGLGGNDVLNGGGGKDSLRGGKGKDILNGGRGDDFLFGGKGNDRLDGGRGQDFLSGDAGDDILKGGKGKDILDGGTGDDIMTGGAGRDFFVFSISILNGDDVITDFEVNEKIRIIGGSRSDVSVAKGGTDTVITYNSGADTITLPDIDLNEADINFIF